MSDEALLALRMVVAFVLGCVIGAERQRHDRPAGLRTHVLVAIACAAVMAASDLSHRTDGSLGVEPTRVVQGILSGIGFIGAGTILKRDDLVIGVTTAATIFLASVVGILCGSGYLILAGALTVSAVVALEGLSWVERSVPFLSKSGDEDLEQRRG